MPRLLTGWALEPGLLYRLAHIRWCARWMPFVPYVPSIFLEHESFAVSHVAPKHWLYITLTMVGLACGSMYPPWSP